MNSHSEHSQYRIRTAQPDDIPAILAVFADEVKAGRMLPRNAAKMQEQIEDWRVAIMDHEIIGCVSLVFFTDKLCEIRSLAVSEPYRQNGLGKKLVESAVKLAEERKAEQVLTLTRAPFVFEQFGFIEDKIENFPHKVQKDCALCPFIDQCDESVLLLKIKEGILIS